MRWDHQREMTTSEMRRYLDIMANKSFNWNIKSNNTHWNIKSTKLDCILKKN